MVLVVFLVILSGLQNQNLFLIFVSSFENRLLSSRSLLQVTESSRALLHTSHPQASGEERRPGGCPDTFATLIRKAKISSRKCIISVYWLEQCHMITPYCKVGESRPGRMDPRGGRIMNPAL